VFVAKIGGCPKSDLIKAGIEPVDQFAHEFIEKSAITWFKNYLDKVIAAKSSTSNAAMRKFVKERSLRPPKPRSSMIR